MSDKTKIHGEHIVLSRAVSDLSLIDKVLSDVIQFRPEVLAFATAMEQTLRKHDHKGGWKELPIEALLRHLEIELEEFKIAADYYDPKSAMKELVDVANYALMLWDRIKLETEGNNNA